MFAPPRLERTTASAKESAEPEQACAFETRADEALLPDLAIGA
jgi:hypothetical protein